MKTDFKSKQEARQWKRSEVEYARAEEAKAKEVTRQAKLAYKSDPTNPEKAKALKDAEAHEEEVHQMARTRADNAIGDYKNFMDKDIQAKRDQLSKDIEKAHKDAGDMKNGNNSGTGTGTGTGTRGSGYQLSDTFYRDLGASLTDRKGGNEFDQYAETSRNQARIAANAAADNEKQAQRAEQAAGRNINAVADERAVASQQSQDKQRVSSKATTLGSGASLMRSEVASDPNTAQAQKVEQQKIANERQDKANEHKRDSAAYDGEANFNEIESRDFDNDWNKVHRLARGEGGGDQQPEPQQPEPQQPEPQQPEPQQPEPTEQAQEPINYNAQKVINGILNGTNGSQLQGDDKRMYDWLAQNKGLKSFTPTSGNSNNWEAEFVKAQGSGANDIMQMLRSKRSPDSAATNFNRGTDAYNEMIKRQGQIPDEQAAQQQQQQPVQAYAEGTDNAEPGVALVGEEGPELVVMQGGEKVVPSDEVGETLLRYLNEDYDGNREPSDVLKKLFMRHFNIGLDEHNKPDENILPSISKFIKLYATDGREKPREEKPQEEKPQVDKQETLANIQSQLANIQEMLSKLV